MEHPHTTFKVATAALRRAVITYKQTSRRCLFGRTVVWLQFFAPNPEENEGSDPYERELRTQIERQKIDSTSVWSRSVRCRTGDTTALL